MSLSDEMPACQSVISDISDNAADQTGKRLCDIMSYV